MTTFDDRLLGSFHGLVVGDALGAPVEFQARDSFIPVTDMRAGGAFDLEAGQWTDDTSMALCIAASIVETGQFDPRDQLARFGRWYSDGYLSSTGVCFDIGNQTRAALIDFAATTRLVRDGGSTRSSGNGSLMRLAPVPLAFARDRELAARASAVSSLSTHPNQECREAVAAAGWLIAATVDEGWDRDELVRQAQLLASRVTVESVATVLAGSFLSKTRDEISSSGYVIHTLEAALWALARTRDFAEGALRTVNLGDDADTVGAVYGQIAGAVYGLDGIPEAWRRGLAHPELLDQLGRGLLAVTGEVGPSAEAAELLAVTSALAPASV